MGRRHLSRQRGPRTTQADTFDSDFAALARWRTAGEAGVGVTRHLAEFAEVFEMGVGLVLGHLAPRAFLEQHTHEVVDRAVR